jgi:hypothetical protein
MQGGTQNGCSAGAVPCMGPRFFFYPFGAAKVAKPLSSFCWTVNLSVVLIVQVQITLLEGTASLAVIIEDMMFQIAPFVPA